MSGQWWSWILSFVGVTGFILAGKKIWWAWYVNIVNQVFWLIYSLVTHQYGFLVATGVYTVVFTKNAYSWTRDRNKAEPEKGWVAFDPESNGGYTDIGPEAFATPDLNVINYKGDNYYRACGVEVNTLRDGGTSSCVKRVDHPGNYHEDYDGRLKIIHKPVIVRDEKGRFSRVEE